MLKKLQYLYLFIFFLQTSSFSEELCNCGTISKDFDYRNAVIAFDKALIVSGFADMKHEFPSEILDFLENPLFDVEGSIHWKVDETIQVNTPGMNQIALPRILFRFAEWTDIRDPIEKPRPKNSLETCVDFEHQEKEELRFFKDYTVFPRAFNALRKDLDLSYERCKEFYHRRIAEFNKGEGIPYLTLKELKKNLKLETKRFEKNRKILDEQEIISFNLSKESLDFCLKYHDRPMAHFERGVFCFLEGETLDALEHVYKAINLGDGLDALQNQAILLKGQMESELGLYADAIESLTRVLNKDPTHKTAYFERASAYFEKGDFDLAFADYLVSGLKSTPLNESLGLFALGLFNGTISGSAQATSEYIPTILSSVQGLGSALWAFTENPVKVSKDFAEAAYHCVEYLIENSLSEIVKEISA